MLLDGVGGAGEALSLVPPAHTNSHLNICLPERSELESFSLSVSMTSVSEDTFQMFVLRWWWTGRLRLSFPVHLTILQTFGCNPLDTSTCGYQA